MSLYTVLTRSGRLQASSRLSSTAAVATRCRGCLAILRSRAGREVTVPHLRRSLLVRRRDDGKVFVRNSLSESLPCNQLLVQQAPPQSPTTTATHRPSSSSISLQLRPRRQQSSNWLSPTFVTSRTFSSSAASVRPKRRKGKRSSPKKEVGLENNGQRPKQKQQPRKKKKCKKKSVDPHQWNGPLGRSVMTEKRYLQDAILQDALRLGGLGSRQAPNPKHLLFNAARNKWDCDLHIKHEAAFGDGETPLFFATLTTAFPFREDLEPYNTNHPHIRQRVVPTTDDDKSGDDNSVDSMSDPATTTVTELVCVGAAPSKKRAEALAAADTIALLYEMGLTDIRDPPSFRQERLLAAKKATAELLAGAQARAKAAYKADLAQAQMMLELLGASRPRFETTEVANANVGKTQWKAAVSCFLRGRAVEVQGEPASRKAEAEGKALIALATSEELKSIVGPGLMRTYQTLIDNSPGEHIASLQIPPLPDDLLQDVEECIGTASDHESRVRRHLSAKCKYEGRLGERGKDSGGSSGTSGSRRRNSHHHYRSAEERRAINKSLQKEEDRRYQKAVENPGGREGTMKLVREALPIKNIQDALVDALKTQQVVVVSGGTGSGKSTQCPQYILEDAIAKNNGADTRIIVTQPRKIAAISVSERVAAERCERIGKSIGYAVRFRRQPPRDYGGSIEFVTTGLLLRRLINDKTLAGISHVMIDEVHERDINTDFLLVLLRDLLKERPDLRVVLMSATLDAKSFSEYFSCGTSVSRVPLLSVPTQPRHPVEVIYLEDLITTSSSGVGEGTKQLAKSLLQYNDVQLKIELEEALEEEDAAEALHSRSRAEDDGEALESDLDFDCDSDSDGMDSDFDCNNDDFDDSRIVPKVSSTTIPNSRVEALRRAVSLREPNGEELAVGRRCFKADRDDKFDSRSVIVELVTKLAQYVSEEELEAGRSGSILCFLPGWDEIKFVMEALEKTHPELRTNMIVLPLHSTIPQDDQQKIFEPANGKVKVILATNIAESSVTIDDVLAVVDSGLVRELNFDAESTMSVMETNKISRASATQRTGRAGRVAPGKCYRLYSRGDLEAMWPRPTPEIQRTPLEATCLQTCSMTSKGVENFLRQALDPPPQDSVSSAMDRLTKLGALKFAEDGRQSLSPLGRCLAKLPLDPATGRMLIMGVVMKCLDPLLTSAACFSSRNVFYNPPGLRDDAKKIRQSFSETSDTMAMIRAYEEFWEIRDTDGWPSAKEWALDNYVSVSAMTSIKAVRSQLLQELRKTGMVPDTDLEGRRGRNIMLRRDADVNRNTDNVALYTAIWATAFPGNLASRRPLGSFGTLRTRMDSHAGLHPSSVAFYRKPPKNQSNLASWYLYQEMVLSSQVFLRSATAIQPEQILLFGGYTLNLLGSETSQVRAMLDDWIVIGGSCLDSVDLLVRVRNDINLALEQKVMFPKAALPKETEEILDIVCDVLDPEGGGIDDSHYS